MPRAAEWSSPPLPARARLVPYVASTALGSTAYIASFAVASLAAQEISGSAELSGLPSAIGTVGTAVAIGLLAAGMTRRGRRPGLLAGYLVAVAGAIASLAAITLASMPLLLLGSAAIGFGNAAIQLSRYAASDLVAPARRAAAVGTVVWGSTAGAVLGPNLLQPAGALAEAFGRPALEGGMAVTVVGFVLTLLVALLWIHPAPAPADEPAAVPARSREADLLADGDPAWLAAAGTGGRLASLAPLRVRIALVGLVSGQIVMVMIMTMTPVHIHDMGESLSTVGLVISAHTLGMFALSPVSGRLVGRLGELPVLLSGFVVLLLAAVLAAVARETDLPVLTLGLLLLGYGWNLTFVAGSGLLTTGASLGERIRLQGLTDSIVWVASAGASLSSGLLLGWAGYPVLAAFGGAFLLLPSVAILLAWRRIPATAPALSG